MNDFAELEREIGSQQRMSRQEREAKESARKSYYLLECERLFKGVELMIHYHLLNYEEMNLVFRMESYFKANKHIGVVWLKQLRRLVMRYNKRLVEKQLMANLLD